MLLHQALTCRLHTAHRPQTPLNPDQKVVVVHLRRILLLALDDLAIVTREFLYLEVLRSSLGWCPRHHSVGNLNTLKPAAPQNPHKAFVIA